MALGRLASLAAALVALAAGWASDSAAREEASPPVYGIDMREAWIPLPDGVRLAADLFVPTGGGAGERFPVLLEYLPYRKAEGRNGRYHSSPDP